MRKLMLAVPVLFLVASCCSVEDLEPVHKMAVENQRNLHSNLNTVLKLYLDTARTHPKYDPSCDEKVLVEITNTLSEQATIATAYVLLMGKFIDGKSVDKVTFEQVIKEIPRLVSEGKDLWAEIQALLEKK